MDYMEAYRRWRESPLVDEATKGELAGLGEAEIEDRFYTELNFGTAGLRGVLGAGENRMNHYVVRRATQGLCAYLKGIPGAAERGVAIAYDSRRCSPEFAMTTALALADAGIKAYLFESLRAVPQLSFTIRHLNCIAGVVITASHNPPAYNGYKVYWEDGGQIGPVQAEAVTKSIREIPWFRPTAITEAEAKEKGLLVMIGKEVDEAYYAATETLLLDPALLKEKGGELKLVYTPLYGAGSVPVRAILNRVGVTNVAVVPEQADPNPDFPGLSAPNPEDPAAFTLAVKLADELGADAILATDPDSDRLGVAVRVKDGSFAVLTGNQIACILLYRILSAKKATGKLPENALVVKSLVSTRLADAICKAFGVDIAEVLTGFRFISEKIDHAVKTGEETFLFGFEESFGFLAGGFSRDKDAICASMLAAEACVYYRERGMTLFDGLQEIYSLFGYFKEKVASYTLTGKVGMEKIAGAMAALRAEPPKAFGGSPVAAVEDYDAREKTDAAGAKTPIDLPKSNVLRFSLENGAWIAVRPSGTEPKLKLYVGANAPDEAAVDALLAGIFGEVDGKLRELLGI